MNRLADALLSVALDNLDALDRKIRVIEGRGECAHRERERYASMKVQCDEIRRLFTVDEDNEQLRHCLAARESQIENLKNQLNKERLQWASSQRLARRSASSAMSS